VTDSRAWVKVGVMFRLLLPILCAALSTFRSRSSLVAENLALRQQQLAVLRAGRRPQLRPIERHSLRLEGSAVLRCRGTPSSGMCRRAFSLLELAHKLLGFVLERDKDLVRMVVRALQERFGARHPR
jgi:hypothetical protein